MKKSAIALLAVAGLAATASATITMDISVVDNTDAGIATANAGDTVYFLITATWDTNDSFHGGVKLDVLLSGAGTGDVDVSQGASTPGSFATDAGLVGAHPLLRGPISNVPPVAAAAAGTLYDGMADTVVSDSNLGATTNFIDLAASPPAFTFSGVENGSIVYRLGVVYNGGTLNAELQVDEGFGTTYASLSSISANFNPTAGDGASATVTPAPASLALLGLGGLAATRRRR